MARRRRYRPPRPGRLVTFGPCLAVPAWGYANTAAAVHWAVAGALFLAVLAIWPGLVVAVLFVLPSVPSLLVPRSWRRAHRRRHGRENCRSARIPKFLRQLVYAADRGRCVYCGNPCLLPGERHVDHGCPWSQGGPTLFWNLFTLCGRCNRVKFNCWVTRRGRVIYTPFADADNLKLAVAILGRERSIRVRWNPLRWIRVAWAIG